MLVRDCDEGQKPSLGRSWIQKHPSTDAGGHDLWRRRSVRRLQACLPSTPYLPCSRCSRGYGCKA